jgi:enamine deaminase RidA (YjgF/YER057c/UK114 family)
VPKFEMFAPGPYGAKQVKEYSYSQVMEVDGLVELSGQGGWHPKHLIIQPEFRSKPRLLVLSTM